MMRRRFAELFYKSVSSPWLWLSAVLLLVPLEVFARVGGGHSYSGGGSRGGGGSSGGGSGGGDGGAILGIIRLLLWLTIEHPVVGIPVDIAIVGFVVYRFSRSGKSAEGFASNNGSGLGLDVSDSRADVNREFAQLRKFDPNFSE